jgi:YidC/Oxa1 family membrane protein insertase
MNFLGVLAPLLGIIYGMDYKLIPSYGWTLIIFTLLTKILMFPLSVKLRRHGRMSAYQPMMQEIQKNGNDKNRQQEEQMSSSRRRACP